MITDVTEPENAPAPAPRVAVPSRDLAARLRRTMNLTGLTCDQLAVLLATGARSVCAWAEGSTMPAGPPVLRVTELLEIFDRLETVLEPGGVKDWIYRGNESLDGASPAELIERGDGWAVAALISRMEKLPTAA